MKIPSSVRDIGKKLSGAGYEAFLVGGCVRDLLLKKTPTDWDIATNAKPGEIIKVFPESFYENKFGTVGVKTEDKKMGVVEITTYRTEEEYSDHRHPDRVAFTTKLEEDLSRRDFTINAIALDLTSPKNTDFRLTDPFEGQKDLGKKLVHSVKDPRKRFQEDALRLMRAVRLAVQLGFKIEAKTLTALKANSKLLGKISKERMRDELVKILLSRRPAEGIELLRETGLLQYILPELERGVGVDQNLHHRRTVYEHGLLSLKKCPSKKLSVRLAAILHDIAKPQTKRGVGTSSTFYNHDFVGARVASKILDRLRFPKKITQKVTLLIKNHMFYYDVDKVTPASVRRLVKKVGPENIKDLIDLRIADRLGSDCPKAKPYKLRHLEYLIEKVSQDPISVKMLAISGNDLREKARVKPGPKMGMILDILLAKVLENPGKNKVDFLIKEAKVLAKEDLTDLRDKAKEKIEQRKMEDNQILKRKHWVQ